MNTYHITLAYGLMGCQAAYALGPSAHDSAIVHDTPADEREVSVEVWQTRFGHLEWVVR